MPCRPSTSQTRTRRPAVARAQASAAAMVVLPVPPLPLTMCRLCRGLGGAVTAVGPVARGAFTSEPLAEEPSTGRDRHGFDGSGVASVRPSARAGPDVQPLALRAEQDQQLRRSRPGAAEPVWSVGVELGDLAGSQDEIELAQPKPEPPVEHVDPFVALVALQLALRFGRHDHLVRPHTARAPGERDQGPPLELLWLRPDPWIAGLGSADQFVERHLVSAGQRQQQLQGRPALARLQSRQGAHRDAGGGGELGQRCVALPADGAEPLTHSSQDVVVAQRRSPDVRNLPHRQRYLLTSDGATQSGTHGSWQGGTYDVVVVGGGAAGLSGALALVRSRRSVLVVDAGEPRNAPAAHVHNYLTRDGDIAGRAVRRGPGRGGRLRRARRARAGDRAGAHRRRLSRRRREPQRRGASAADRDRVARRAARRSRARRALGDRRAALPVLPRVGGARPAHRRARRRSRWRCTRP